MPTFRLPRSFDHPGVESISCAKLVSLSHAQRDRTTETSRDYNDRLIFARPQCEVTRVVSKFCVRRKAFSVSLSSSRCILLREPKNITLQPTGMTELSDERAQTLTHTGKIQSIGGTTEKPARDSFNSTSFAASAEKKLFTCARVKKRNENNQYCVPHLDAALR